MKKNQFTMIDEKGNEIVYDVLFTFESEETNKNYICFRDLFKRDRLAIYTKKLYNSVVN